jgi:hypothetical protein
MSHAAPLQTFARRRGTAYLLVVSSAALLAAAAVGASEILGARSRERVSMGEGDQARAAAQAGLEVACELLRKDPGGSTWRQRADDNQLTQNAPTLGGATYSLRISPESGTPKLVGSFAPIVVESRADLGGWTHRLRATFDPTLGNNPALSYPLVVGNTLNIIGGASGAGTIVCNSTARAHTASVSLPLLAASRVGTTFDGGFTMLTTPFVLPPETVVDEYAARGTRILLGQLVSNQLRRVVLSAGQNPFGAPNAEGIYVIDCMNQDVSVTQVRVLGTLVLLRPGPNTAIRDQTFFEAAKPEQPVLLVGGSIGFATSAGDLSESFIGVNLNPAGAAHHGTTDADTSDFYPSMFEGIVYVNGDLKSSGFTTVEGSLIVRGSAEFTERVVLRAFPPDRPVTGMSEASGWRLRSVDRPTRK